MFELNAQTFAAAVEAHLPAGGAKFCIAFSGGVDSTVLLHLAAAQKALGGHWQFRAVHVDHQLQSASADWAQHCLQVATSLGVPCEVVRVTVEIGNQGLEAAARKCRYEALARGLERGEVLLTAHHADDQAETVLLALMRGSGVQGLAAMPACKPWAVGWHLRPLLAFTRRDIAACARERGIDAIDDPTNRALRHDRNFLRHEVLPRLATRWPAVAANLVRSADHLAEALELLEATAIEDLSACEAGAALRVAELLALPAGRRRNLLRYWLRRSGMPAPTTRKLLGLEQDLARAAPDRSPQITWPGVEVCRHRGLLYVRSAQSLAQSEGESGILEWRWRDALVLPHNLGRLTLVPSSGSGLAAERLPAQLTVRFRSGGERIRLPGRTHRHEVKKLLQESGVLPWWRDRLPLIYADRQLVAVGHLFHAEEVAARPGEIAMQVSWDEAPPWRAERDRVLAASS